MLLTGIAGLILALIGTIASGVGMSMMLSHSYRQRRAVRAEAQAYEIARETAEAVDGVRTDLLVLELEVTTKPVNYRHNVHCPACGRFARRALPESNLVVVCSAHDLLVRWKDVPVDWYSAPAMVVQGQPITLVSADPVSMDPVTEPLHIIQSDLGAELELEQMGAVV